MTTWKIYCKKRNKDLNMQKTLSNNDISKISLPAAGLAIGTATVAVLLLASLLVLSPEFDPSWRMISEYANGSYEWVLALMFTSWGLSSWALAFAIRSQVRTRTGKIGLVFLTLAGMGEVGAALFNIRNPLHDVVSSIAIISLPIAALLLSVRLGRTQPWAAAKKALLWTANLTWMSVVLFIVTFIIMIVTYTQAGGDMTPNKVAKVLPYGVIAFVGWANRLLVLAYCAWVATVAWLAIQLRREKSQ
jgi:hypothetical membrane protein